MPTSSQESPHVDIIGIQAQPSEGVVHTAPRGACEWRIVTRDDLPFDVYGFTDYGARCIIIRAGMTPEEVRCTLVHELTHVERGPFTAQAARVEEAIVDLITTARVVPTGALPGLMGRVSAEGRGAVADALGVDPWTVDLACVLERAVAELLAGELSHA
jgi:hypothetical protein